MSRPFLDRTRTGYDRDMKALMRIRAAIIADPRWAPEQIEKLTESLDVVIGAIRVPTFGNPDAILSEKPRSFRAV